MNDDHFVSATVARSIDTSPAITRYSNSQMDSILGHALPVLDHGFIRVMDYMGGDADITEAARVSYARGTKKTSDDQGLLNYLMRHHHSTPFEMCEIKLHVKLPLFVARQWVRHRTASINEMSARYSILDKEFYFPSDKVLAAQSSINGQGRDETTKYLDGDAVLSILHEACDDAYGDYENLHTVGTYEDNQGFTHTGKGLSRELSRMVLPTNIYTQWYWKTNLHNLFNFLRLRMDHHAQYEIRVYADLIHTIVQDWVPMASSAFQNYKLNSINFSQKELAALNIIMMDFAYTDAEFRMSTGELREFKEKVRNIKKANFYK